MGADGPTDDPVIRAARLRRIRAMLASLFLSQGVPMILAGDEGGRSQRGNNNAYCQDNDLTWTDWDALDDGLVQAVADIATLRARLALARTGFSLRNEIGWWHPGGRWMEDSDWQDAGLCCLGLTLPCEDGGRLLALFNAGDDRDVTLPAGDWRRVMDTAETPVTCDRAESGAVAMGWQSVVLWQGAADQSLRAKAQT